MVERTLTQDLLAKIHARSARIGVLGLGYVGLPLALEFVDAGFNVVGFDVDVGYVAQLRAGRSAVIDVPSARLRDANESGRLTVTAHGDDLDGLDVFLICVPTPLSKSRQPDLSYVEAAITLLAGLRVSGSLVVLESTTYPGTTAEVLRPALEAHGGSVDRDFLLAFSPERVDPGNVRHPLPSIPKVVGGVSDASTDVAAALYDTVFARVHRVSDATTAELSKLLENTFRNVNIALANEMKMICDTLGVDIWEVIEAAATKPFGFMPFYPGPGVGGHCIPLDPQYLVYRSRLSGFEPRLVAVADQINQDMPQYTVHTAMDRLNALGRPLRGSTVLVLGVTYKPGVPDVRESPALVVIDLLLDKGADVAYADPYVQDIELPSRRTLRSVSLEALDLTAYDLVMVLTAHAEFPYDRLAQMQDSVVDTRGSVRLATR